MRVRVHIYNKALPIKRFSSYIHSALIIQSAI